MDNLKKLANLVAVFALALIASGLLVSFFSAGGLESNSKLVLLASRQRHDITIFLFSLGLFQTVSGIGLLLLALQLRSRLFTLESGHDRQSQAEEELRLSLTEARKRERSLIEKAVDVICVIDVNGKFVSLSPASEAAWGYTPKELENQSLMEIIPSDSDDILNSILGAAKSIDRISFECKLRKRDGNLLDVVWTGHWSATDGGLFCIVHDITLRKEAEEKLRINEQKLRLTLEGLPAGILLFSALRQIELANSEAGRLLGYEPLALIGKEVESVLEGELPPKRTEETRSVGSETIEMTAKRSDGSKFPAGVSLNVLDDTDGEKLLAVFLDKTEQHELDRLKREFTAMVVHDLRTPLSVMYGLLGSLDEGILGQLNARGKSISLSARKDIKRLLKLINELLDIEKLSAGQFMLECAEISVRNAVKQAIASVTLMASEKQIRIESNESFDGLCWADEERIVQVLLNILANAIKFSQDNSTIYVTSEYFGSLIRTSVTDTGSAIPPEKISRIFEKFEQVSLDDSKIKGGTGLGLTICKGIIEAHGGEIGVAPKLDQGNCFWFTLPISSEQPEHDNE